jgi:hypothetical protein
MHGALNERVPDIVSSARKDYFEGSALSAHDNVFWAGSS